MPDLVQPEIPDQVAHVWRWYCQIAGRRSELKPITWQEFDAWSRMMNIKPTEWEMSALCAIDWRYLQ